jgi:cysteine desulfurase
VDLADLESRLRPATRLVSVMLGNNETGILQPVRRVVEIVREKEMRFTTQTQRHGESKGVKAAVATPTRRASEGQPDTGTDQAISPAWPPAANGGRMLVHTDAVQVVGKAAVDFRGLGVDLLSASGHKFHGPRGVGLLLLRHDVPISPLLFGGFQQEGLRPGTEPVELAVGLHAALAVAMRELAQRAARMRALRDRFESALRSALPGLVIHGAAVERLPHTSNLSFAGCDRQALFIALDLAGVACSTGSACASGSSEPSAALAAMGLPAEQLGSSLRFSLGAGTTADEVDQAVAQITRICRGFPHSARPGKTIGGGRVAG